MRYDFDGRYGKRIGVIVHRDGRREIFVSLKEDPDACAQSMILSEDEANIVSDLMGGSTVVRRIGQAMQDIEGLAIDWVTLDASSEFVNHRIDESALRSRTGSSIVAILRSGKTIPAPPPDFTLLADDMLVIVGTAADIKKAWNLLSPHTQEASDQVDQTDQEQNGRGPT